MCIRDSGIAVNLKELYNSESKTQVYGHLHDMMSDPNFDDIGKFF